MVDIGILEECDALEWALPCFIIPKKDGCVRKISDPQSFCKYVKGKKYQLPVIEDIMCCLKGYKYFTKLEISVQYYTFELDKESHNLYVMITLFGKYKYKCLPMGLKCAPHFAQQIME